MESAQSPWVRERIEALEAFYGFTPQGRQLLERLDVRQMEGQPGWFGSYGLHGWTGVGEAKPEAVIHELGHAYWGAFPVSGRPDLSWDNPQTGNSYPAMGQYHRDLIAFLAQPPDPYEPLRERLRNIPNVLLGELPPLFHFGEADLVHATGGSSQLLPPILRKYYDRFLTAGPFDSWYSALEWYQGLSPEDARAAGAYFGLAHLSLSQYRELKPSERTVLPQGTGEVVAQEERQRLVDFARQFDVITGAEGAGGDSFSVDLFFLRGYLGDKLALYKRHPETLAGLRNELPVVAADLERAMGVFASLEGRSPGEQADILGQHFQEPFFYTFWPLVDNALLMELHRRGVDPLVAKSQGRGIDGEIERLGRMVDRAGSILGRAQEDPSAGAAGLGELIEETPKEDMGEVGLVIELLRAADGETVRAIGREMDDDLVRRLLKDAPGALRQMLGPGELLTILGISAEASAEEMVRGIQELLQSTSGNFRIDQPYLSEVYALVAKRGERQPQEALDILLRSGLFLEDLAREHPQEAVAILSSDLEQAVSLIAGVEGPGRTPQGLVHGLIGVDPLLAARLTSLLDSKSPLAVQEALIHFAYDSYRKARLPSLNISPEKDGLFFLALADLRGDRWVIERMAKAIATYDGYAKEGTVPPDFLQEYRHTLGEAVGLVDGPVPTGRDARLCNIVEEAFSSRVCLD
ncbi:MAG: hypothetical protein HW388_155 [Dehalococcoidia bacterium]|nr:hypothetical protein [Dehalococcoidia bacterium]